MKKKIISSMVAIITMLNFSVSAYATPVTDEKKEEIEQSQDEYRNIEDTIRDLENKIDALTDEIEPIFFEIEENNKKIKELESEIAIIEENIDSIKESIKVQQEVLGERLRATYKGGFYNNYISILLSSNNFGSLLESINTLGKIFSLDKSLIENLNNEKIQLDDNISTLDEKKRSLDNINIENVKKVEELNTKKEEQQIIIDEMYEKKNSMASYIEELENELVTTFLNDIKEDKSIDELNNLITALNGLKNQVQTDAVINSINNGIVKAQGIISGKEVEIRKAREREIITNNATTDSTDDEVNDNSDVIQTEERVVNESTSSIVSYAYQFIGLPYVYGATGPSSFDCSGFTQHVFSKFGYSITRTTYTQVNQGTHVSRENLQPGDLVFTRGTVSSPGHVGIYVGNGKMIHASRPGVGIIVGDIYDYVTARRIVN
ncbi:MAG: NlpC/P60 family protein [Clostridium perfringens]|nr:NlpC/P60 family protein [Clostridium perfringens]